jgi:hypothetical protein
VIEPLVIALPPEAVEAIVEQVVELVLARLEVPVVPPTPAQQESHQPDLADEIAAYLGEHERERRPRS